MDPISDLGRLNDGSQLFTGYMHPDYARSLAEFGAPRQLLHCGGWILERQIPDSSYQDAMGCYPLFTCQDWSRLHIDLKEIEDDLVSLALVTDPFGEFDLAYLKQCFDLVIPFKQHFVVNLHDSPINFVSKHHQKYARKALRKVRVERCADPGQHLDAWSDLYQVLIDRHHIKGLQAFSKKIFTKQLAVPGMVMFRVLLEDKVIGANLFYVQNDIVYGHLSAFSLLGYELGAPYAVKWVALEYFSHTRRWLNLGAGAGISKYKTNGLDKFKQGWSTGTRTVYFCGRILNRQSYEKIVEATGSFDTNYFPAYRKNEFK